MWDLRTALGRNDALKIITGGMRLSPNAPSMLAMRDAILQSAQVNNVNLSTVWSVFAARGMGFLASTPSADATSAVEDFSMPPTSVTNAASGIAEDGATLNGSHNSGGKATDYRFEYGTTSSYGDKTPVTDGGSGNVPVPVTADISGLTAATQYHYRLIALRGGVILSKGNDQTFTTSQLPVAPPVAGPVPPADTTPPTVKIKKAPKKTTVSKKAKVKAKVTFTSEPGATFTCRLGQGKFKKCTSPFSAKAKAKPGKGMKHTIEIMGTDQAGNASKPTAVKFKAVRKG